MLVFYDLEKKGVAGVIVGVDGGVFVGVGGVAGEGGRAEASWCLVVPQFANFRSSTSSSSILEGLLWSGVLGVVAAVVVVVGEILVVLLVIIWTIMPPCVVCS